MKQRKLIFKDSDIVEFCKATRDTNEIHDPIFMGKIGKRVIVPGMLALSSTVSLVSEFVKSEANMIKVLFNSLLSSGDFVTLAATPEVSDPFIIRLSAFNHKDTFTSREDFTKICRCTITENFPEQGTMVKIPVLKEQVESFCRLTDSPDPDISNFLFAVAYASQGLMMIISDPCTDVEKEIDELINGDNNVSPFYQSLEIFIPPVFPSKMNPGTLDYTIYFEREKRNKLYTAHVTCKQQERLIYHSRYTLVGISDSIILRMAKDIRHPRIIPSKV